MFPVCLLPAPFGLRLRNDRTRSVLSCPGAALSRTDSGVPSTPGGNALRQRGAEIPTQHRQRIGRRLLLLSRNAAASAVPIDRKRSGDRHSQAVVQPPPLAEFPSPFSTIVPLPILQLSTTSG